MLTEQSQETSHSEELKMTDGCRVLVVDDSLDAVNLISAILNHYKCDVTMAFDGQDCVQLLMDNEYDLVVLDWSMPRMSGSETLMMVDNLFHEKSHLRENRKIPVVIYTGHKEEDLDLPRVKYFRYLGCFNKAESFRNIIRSFDYILKTL